MRSKIEAKITQQLPELLLEKAIIYHCRQGIREDCDCSFCSAKRRASRDIENVPKFHSFEWKWYPGVYWEYLQTPYEKRKELRNDKRKEARIKLEQLKQVVL